MHLAPIVAQDRATDEVRDMVEIAVTLPTEIATFAAAYTNVILIPGPSFVVVCEAGLSATRRDASLVAIGVATGAAFLAATIVEAAPVLQASPSLMAAGRIACAIILLGMGFRILRRSMKGSRQIEQRGSAQGVRMRLMTGFIAAASNPVSFASFTTAALAIGRPEQGTDCAIIATTIFLMALGWFNTMAVVFSQPILSTHYGRVARTLGSIMGCVLIAKALVVLVPAI